MRKKIILLIILISILIIGIFFILPLFNGKEVTIKFVSSDEKEYREYNVGDVVFFNDGNWYVIRYSASDDDYVTLISDGILYLGDEGIDIALNGIYETSKLKEYLENKYIDNLGVDNLVEKNGYMVRLFNADDMKELLNVTYNEDDDSYEIIDCPTYICLTNTFYATMIDTDESYNREDVLSTWDADFDEDKEYHLKYYNIFRTFDDSYLESVVDNTTLFVRPVINVKKDSLQ